MKISPILLLSLLLFSVVIPAAMAADDDLLITFSDLDFDKNTQILIYDGTGELVKETNTSGTVVLNSSYSYLFVFKPSEQVWFQNPLNMLELLKVQMPVYMSYILIFVAVVGVIVVIGRAFRVW